MKTSPAPPPCNDAAKHPLTPHGCKDATTDPEMIRRWHAETHGLCNWGLATGRESGVWVLDVDGETGLASLTQLERQHGPLPLTPTLETGGGGRHCLFAWPGDGMDIKSRARFYPGLDTRGTGGYSILPPACTAPASAMPGSRLPKRPW